MKISIIVPIYNSEKFLAQCIESVLAQHYQGFELLLVDDGSTDTSLEICKQYAKLDSRIKVYHLKNGGVSRARNYGLGQALGEWITFLDSDDWISDDYLDFLCVDPQDDVLNVVQAKMSSEKKSKAWPIKFEAGHYKWSESFMLDNLLVYGTPWGKLYNRRLLVEHNIYFDETISNHEDHLFYLTYLLHINQLHVCAGGCYYYRIGNGGTLSRKLPNYKSILYAYDKLDFVYRQLLLQNGLVHTKLPSMRHFLLYVKIKSLRSVFYNENTKRERRQVLSIFHHKEILNGYRCVSLNSLLMKTILLMPGYFRYLMLFLLRRYLKG